MLGPRPQGHGLVAVEPLLRHLAPAVPAVVLDVDVPVAAVGRRDAEEGAKEEDGSPCATPSVSRFILFAGVRMIGWGRLITHCVLLEAFFLTRVSTRRMQNGQSTVSAWSPSMCSGVTVATAVDMSSVPAYPIRW